MSASASARPQRGVPAWLAAIAYGAAVIVVAAIGGAAASSSAETYRSLDLPPFAPPSAVFGPVWTVLYVLIATSGWLVWRRVGVDAAMVPYVVQLVLNALWTPLFFAAGWYGVALIEIVTLLAAVLWTIVAFRTRSRVAVLLLPYLAWVGFATALNASIWWLNR
ncbi:tryptophan-rich sensory protein [Nocardioides endophyticus]|uniref:Tryptophan-rich sensory protein n=1 Tax=Nocardioides endophyticus TaxID=1353775 RepID=A0ABP8YJL1_9ACTN